MVKLQKNGKPRLGPSTNVHRRHIQKQTHLRTPRTIRMLKTYDQKFKKDEETGKIKSGSVLTGSDKNRGEMARVPPSRKWFGNSRVIGSKTLQSLRDVMAEKSKDPYSIVLKQSKLPMALLEPMATSSAYRKPLDFKGTFGKKALRKRPTIASRDMDELQQSSKERIDNFTTKKDNPENISGTDSLDTQKVHYEASQQRLLKKGQSNRIWAELYKVVDSSDVLLYVLDARDPIGTRSKYIEDYIKKEKRYKHLVFILNKTDLIPAWATARWLQILSKDRPTIAMHSSTTHPFGKGNLINLLRQFSRLHNVVNKPKRSANRIVRNPISVGIIGYPNAGKSSLINTLRRERVCKVAPIPGETKVWQYVMLTRSIYLIDCPGVVYDKEANDDVQSVLKGIVRVERLGNTSKNDIVHAVLSKLNKSQISGKYGVEHWTTVDDFLEKLARRYGKLLGGGEPDTDASARVVLYDWQRGALPWYVPPPFESNQKYREALRKSEAEHIKNIEDASALGIQGEKIVSGEEVKELQMAEKERKQVKMPAKQENISEHEQEKQKTTDSDAEDEALWEALMNAQ